MHTLLIGQREAEKEREKKRERERERGREKEGEGERESVRKRERKLLFLFFKGMTGALASFSYLVIINWQYLTQSQRSIS